MMSSAVFIYFSVLISLTSCPYQKKIHTPEFLANIPPVDFCLANANKTDVRYYLFKSGAQTTAITLNYDFVFSEEDKKLPLKILVHGFTSNITSPWYKGIKREYFKKGPHNVIYIDWSPAANKSFGQSCANIKPVGEFVAEMIVHLRIPLEKVHLIGHSLGSHLAGFIGKNVQKNAGEKVGRITGLDPAGPGFEYVGYEARLSKFDASFVDIIHTDAGYYGIIKTIGHADFFVNGGKFQNGCPRREVNDNCSHARATEYFIESINTKDVMATSGKISDTGTILPSIKSEEIKFGDATPSTARGIYYLHTDARKPYLQIKKT